MLGAGNKSAYELQRDANVASNKTVLEALGLTTLSQPPSQPAERQRGPAQPHEASRASSRLALVPKSNYDTADGRRAKHARQKPPLLPPLESLLQPSGFLLSEAERATAHMAAHGNPHYVHVHPSLTKVWASSQPLACCCSCLGLGLRVYPVVGDVLVREREAVPVEGPRCHCVACVVGGGVRWWWASETPMKRQKKKKKKKKKRKREGKMCMGPPRNPDSNSITRVCAVLWGWVGIITI